MEAGYLSLVLHAHLPYVHHPESEDIFEERWLYESLIDCYLPLLQNLTYLQQHQILAPITISLSPPLLTMLQQPLVHQRFQAYLANLLNLAQHELKRTELLPKEHRLAAYYQRKFLDLQEYYHQELKQDIIGAFKQLFEAGNIELITCAGTHGFLPLMATPQAVEGQICEAIKLFTETFGQKPKGMWLPECAYFPGVDAILTKHGIVYTFLDSHGLEDATPKPSAGVYNPVTTHGGLRLFARDLQSAEQVWSSKVGYPGDYFYREYYRDIGFDLPHDEIKPFLHSSGIRHNTGFKYYRITGSDNHKALYDPEAASKKADLHAGHFCDSKRQQLLNLNKRTRLPPLIMAPFDAELFGHWWYEGPQWLLFVLKKLAFDYSEIKLITPSQYLARFEPQELAEPPRCSWGEEGSYKVWLHESNHWIYRHLHKCEAKLVHLVSTILKPTEIQHRALQQCTRELYMAQSSDWAFIMKSGTTVGYAIRRTNEHIENFRELGRQLEEDQINQTYLSRLEVQNPIFPQVDYSVFKTTAMPAPNEVDTNAKTTRILMLAWEYPPKMVGGLARHVHDLSRALVKQGIEVHVITATHPDTPEYQIDDGVHVHRVQTLVAEENNFFDWIFSLNIAAKEYAHRLCKHLRFDLIHVHDWLMAYAAIGLKKRNKLPLVATIHATEYGRNTGLHTHLQRHISSVEWELTYEAQQVICCSNYMRKEIQSVFSLPTEKLFVIPNGVDPENIKPSMASGIDNKYKVDPADKMVFYVGRLVQEKGVQVLLEAMPDILNANPEAILYIAGKGPMLSSLQAMTKSLAVEHRVRFLGFIDDETRNYLLSQAHVAVFPSLYEPFGIVALEGMAAGVPVVLSAIGGLAEIVEDKADGLMVPAGDVQALSEAVSSLLTYEEIAATLAENALQKIEKIYNWTNIAIETINIYRKMLS